MSMGSPSTTSDDKPALDLESIRAWVNGTEHDRGRTYLQNGALIQLRRRGSMLLADCRGTSSRPYKVQALVGTNEVVEANCTCPAGWSGRCKHVAALLQAWIDFPESFDEREDLETLIDRLSRSELVKVLNAVLMNNPELEELVRSVAEPGEIAASLPSPNPQALAPTKRSGPSAILDPTNVLQSLDPDSLQVQIRQIFATAGDEWSACYSVLRDLRPFVSLAETYLNGGDLLNAATVFRIVSYETMDFHRLIDDPDSSLEEIVNTSVEGLGRCLSEQSETARRNSILRTLFEIYRRNLQQGRHSTMGAGAIGLIRSLATPAERRSIAGWVRLALPESRGWHREDLGAFLLELEGEEVDDEAYLKICRDTGRRSDLIKRLLLLNRLDEASAELKNSNADEFLELADLFVDQGHGRYAEQVVRERTIEGDDRTRRWLKDLAIKQGDTDQALALSIELFWRFPTGAAFEEIKHLSGSNGRWPTIRDQLISRLEKEDRRSLLTEIYLVEDRIDLALSSLESVKRPPWSLGVGGLPLGVKVAKAAERHHPEKAIPLYAREAERLIATRGRGNYAKAIDYLRQIRDLYERTENHRGWTTFIEDFRKRYKKLRTLLEELKNQGI